MAEEEADGEEEEDVDEEPSLTLSPELMDEEPMEPLLLPPFPWFIPPPTTTLPIRLAVDPGHPPITDEDGS